MAGRSKNKNVETEVNDLEFEKVEDKIIVEVTPIVNEIKEEVIENKPIPIVETIEKKEKWIPDLHRQICVKNISRGKLVYVSKKQNGFETIWENTGDEDYLELQELVSLKNTYKRFVTEPWIRINEQDEVEILKYLQIFKNYEKILDVDVDKMLTLTSDRFEKKFKTLPESFKQAIAGKAAGMMKSGELDSLKIKNIIEKDMDIDLSFYARE